MYLLLPKTSSIYQVSPSLFSKGSCSFLHDLCVSCRRSGAYTVMIGSDHINILRNGGSRRRGGCLRRLYLEWVRRLGPYSDTHSSVDLLIYTLVSMINHPLVWWTAMGILKKPTRQHTETWRGKDCTPGLDGRLKLTVLQRKPRT